MSSVLDEIIVQDVAANCPNQFQAYHKCLSQPGQDCSKQQEQLASCIREEVPSVKKVLSNCGKMMQEYEECVMANRETRTVNEKCMGKLTALRECAMKQVDTKLAINDMK